MKPSLVTSETVLDKRRIKTNGTYPIKLRITYQRFQKYYKLKFNVTENFWQEVEDGRRSKAHTELRDALSNVKHKVSEILHSFEKKGVAFDFDLFEKTFFGQELESLKTREKAQDVYCTMDQYIQQLDKEGRASTAMSYTDALRSFKKFQATLQFRDVTAEWLLNYEKQMLTQGKSVSTVGIYIRALRIIMNQALENGTIATKEYPFGKNRYQIPASKNVKKALQLLDVRAVRNFPVEYATPQMLDRFLTKSSLMV